MKIAPKETRHPEAEIPFSPTETGNSSVWFSRIFQLLAITGISGGVALHFLGHVTHIHYMRMWGIDSGLFPKKVEWASINGYYTVVDRFANLYLTLKENWVILAGIWLGISFLILYWALLDYLLKKDNAKSTQNWLQRYLPQWVHLPLTSLLLGGSVTLFIPGVLLVVSMIMAIPGFMGESRGKAAFEKEVVKFKVGCKGAKAGSTCFEIHKAGNMIARGFLIDSSETHIALFDIEMQRARVLEREGTEIIADLPETDNPKQHK
jgi:hypothetical protein